LARLLSASLENEVHAPQGHHSEQYCQVSDHLVHIRSSSDGCD